MDPLVPCCTVLLSLSPSVISKSLIIIGCIILGAFFAASETALSQCNRFKNAARSSAGLKKAKILERLLDKFDNCIIDILILINVVRVVCALLAGYLFDSFIPNSDLSAVINTIVMTIIVFLFSEMLPKNIASKNPNRIAENIAIPLYLMGLVLTPISVVFRLLVVSVKKVFKVNEDENQITEEDFTDIVENIEDEGKLDADESDLIQAALDFGDFTVLDVLTPIDKMVMYNAKLGARRDLIKFAKDVNYTRVPVYENDSNNIIGILHIRKYLINALNNRNYFNLKSVLSKPIFVSSKTTLDDMIDIFQANRSHIAIVKDDEVVLGMVTMEDAVEKLIGNVDENTPLKLYKGGRK